MRSHIKAIDEAQGKRPQYFEAPACLQIQSTERTTPLVITAIIEMPAAEPARDAWTTIIMNEMSKPHHQAGGDTRQAVQQSTRRPIAHDAVPRPP